MLLYHVSVCTYISNVAHMQILVDVLELTNTLNLILVMMLPLCLQ